MKDRVGGSREYEGYGSLNGQGGHEGDDWGRYNDDEDFFDEFKDGQHKDGQQNAMSPGGGTTAVATSTKVSAGAPAPSAVPAPKKADDWDEWDNF